MANECLPPSYCITQTNGIFWDVPVRRDISTAFAPYRHTSIQKPVISLALSITLSSWIFQMRKRLWLWNKGQRWLTRSDQQATRNPGFYSRTSMNTHDARDKRTVKNTCFSMWCVRGSIRLQRSRVIQSCDLYCMVPFDNRSVLYYKTAARRNKRICSLHRIIATVK